MSGYFSEASILRPHWPLPICFLARKDSSVENTDHFCWQVNIHPPARFLSWKFLTSWRKGARKDEKKANEQLQHTDQACKTSRTFFKKVFYALQTIHLINLVRAFSFRNSKRSPTTFTLWAAPNECPIYHHCLSFYMLYPYLIFFQNKTFQYYCGLRYVWLQCFQV